MRKRGLPTILAVVAAYMIITAIFSDYFIERKLEEGLEIVSGAKVEIDNLDFKLFELSFSWNRLQIANKNHPWYNIVETGKASFAAEVRPLFWKKIIINEIVLEDAMSNTRRATDGTLRRNITSADRQGLVARTMLSIKDQLNQIPGFNLSGLMKELNLDSLVNINQLSSVSGYQKLKMNADSSFGYWENELTITDYQKRIEDIEREIESLNLEGVNDLAALTRALEAINKLYKNTNTLKAEVETGHQKLTATFSDLQQKLEETENLVFEDVNRVLQLANIQPINLNDISMLLLGDPVARGMKPMLDYIELGRRYLPIAKKLIGTDKLKNPPRFMGQNIYFPFRYAYPDFLIRTLKISAATAAGDTGKAYFFNGILSGITDQPMVYGKPARIALELTKTAGNSYSLNGSLDHTKDQARDSLWVQARHFDLGKLNLKENKNFPQAVEAGKGNINLSGIFFEDTVDMKMKIEAEAVKFLFEGAADDRVSLLIRDILTGVNEISMNAELSGDASDYGLKIRSNIDQLLGDQLLKTFDSKIREARLKVEHYVNAATDKNRKQIKSRLAKNSDGLYTKLSDLRDRTKKQYEKIEVHKNDVEIQIEKEKQKLTNKGKKALENILKR